MNRNWLEEVGVPIGEDNAFSPGPADRGQPTRFLPRRNRRTTSWTTRSSCLRPVPWGPAPAVRRCAPTSRRRSPSMVRMSARHRWVGLLPSPRSSRTTACYVPAGGVCLRLPRRPGMQPAPTRSGPPRRTSVAGNFHPRPASPSRS